MLLPKQSLLLTLTIIGSYFRPTCTEAATLEATLKSQISSRDIQEHTVSHENYWQASSVLYGLTKVASNYNDSGSSPNNLCLRELREIQQSILQKKPWAMKVLDASASKSSGFMFQHNYWLGSPLACAAANDPIIVTLQEGVQKTMKPGIMDDMAPFEMDFRVVYVEHNSPWQMQFTFIAQPILHLGLCLPTSCSESEVQRLSFELMQQKTFMEAEVYGMQSKVLYVKDLKLKEEFFARRSLKILIGMLVFTAVMICWANNLKHTALETEPKTQTSDKANPKAARSLHRAFGVNSVKMFVESFDLAQNCSRLFAIAPYTSRDIPVINGLRSLLSLAVLVSHVCWFTRHTMNNAPLLMSSFKKQLIRVPQFGFLTVDVFFAISGFLHVFMFLRDIELMERIRQNTFVRNAKLFFSMLMHRYIRLVPLLLIAMGLGDLVSAYLNDVSMFHVYDRYDQRCSKNWWHNLLFIQNYFPAADMCLLWSWSLSCEMQFFIWATISLFTYAKHPKFVKRGVIVLLAANIGWTLFKGVTSKYKFSLETVFATVDEVYVNPSLRVTGYMIGNIAAWYFVTQQQSQTNSPLTGKVLWNWATLLMVGSVFTLYWIDVDYFMSIFLYTLRRFMISLAVCCVIICSAMGSRCWWSHLLEARVFQHMNRLTYAIYLINPVIVMMFSGLNESSLQVNLSIIILLISGYILITYVVCIGFTLAFEVPYCNLSRIILKSHKQKSV